MTSCSRPAQPPMSFIPCPKKRDTHEGTWLQWPHEYQYGKTYRNRLDQTWVDMTKELASSEKVHLIVYDETEQTRVTALLTDAGVALTNIDFSIYKTDDVWVRDNGPHLCERQKWQLANRRLGL